MSTSTLTTLLASVRSALATPSSLLPSTSSDQQARLDLIDLLPELNAALIGDTAHLRELAWSAIHVLPLAAISRWKLASHVPLDGEITYHELSSKTGISSPLLKRILRHAMTSRLFLELPSGEISHSPTSRLLVTNDGLAAFVDLHTETALKSIAHTLDALERWPESTDPREGGYSLALGRGGETSVYEEVAKDEGRMVGFGRAMRFFSEGEGYEVGSLVEGYAWGRIGKGVVVDVGGANGFASAAISKAFPELEMVVQDIQDMKVEYPGANIRWMVHDYFTPQPVVGADVYLYRFVFHNLYDEKAVEVLRAAVPALKKKGARILINDECLSEPGKVRWRNERAARGLDAIMLACMSGRERESSDWEGLFEKADPRYKFLSAKIAPQSRLWLIEAEWTG
ncbi:S-adenosyl-L-methionine-dependent methyltransferase [Mollisia scopiformis]|uniref:S-adenosyl-L-methionine-dependent methyltransferase n=1 Tax=Mollisia scopiformis TaxID=149040 RepID=A0A194WTN7_MOLSC|nr:S-adenosyl-L-methionine-dependent methyltransferase [Mollisia scopiformis]KUJ11316.1 S-adenosyl-L-methionine-dependent methyltransferase [Mollisia scopiformis]